MPSVSTSFEPQFWALPWPPRNNDEAQRLYNHIRTVAYWLDAAPLLLAKLPFSDALPHLDKLKYIPGLGFDALIGAILPVGGDIVGLVLGLYQVVLSLLFGLPLEVVGWMLFNVIVDTLVGSIPLLGDALDFLWMSNLKNLSLLEDHLLKSKRWAVLIAPPGAFQPTGQGAMGWFSSLFGTGRQRSKTKMPNLSKSR